MFSISTPAGPHGTVTASYDPSGMRFVTRTAPDATGVMATYTTVMPFHAAIPTPAATPPTPAHLQR